MAKAIYCDCGLVCRGDSDEALLREAEQHLRDEHPGLAGRVRRSDLLAMAVEIDREPARVDPAEREGALVVRREGRFATLILNRPSARNALSLELLHALGAELDAIAADPGVRAVILSGAGPAFCAGHDLRQLHGATPDAIRRIFDADAALMRRLRALPQPVVAAVHGPASAAGCHLVAACDLAVASADATFAVPGPAMGIVGTTAMIEVGRLVGRRRAMQMLLSGAPISAETALAWGLVNAVVGTSDLGSAARAMASSASSGAPGTTALAKRGLHEVLDLPVGEAYDRATEVTARTIAGDEAQEGIGAFLERRTPRWRQR